MSKKKKTLLTLDTEVGAEIVAPPVEGGPAVVRFKKLHPEAKTPRRATSGSAGWDVAAVAPVVIPTKKTVLVPTGIAIALPSGYVADFRARSSMAKRGALTVVGTVDSDFRGELFASVTNTSQIPIKIKAGDRIGQLVIHRLPEVEFVEGELDETGRGDGGWGSTGA